MHFFLNAGCERGRGHTIPDSAAMAIKKLGGVLKHTLEELFGPTLHLSASSMELMFPSSFQRLGNAFYRSKVTSWMAAQEEDYRWTHHDIICFNSFWRLTHRISPPSFFFMFHYICSNIPSLKNWTIWHLLLNNSFIAQVSSAEKDFLQQSFLHKVPS